MRNMLRYALMCIAMLPVWAGAAGNIEAKVVGISDGDTITVLTKDKQQIRIRLYGVDTPESHQAYGTRARQFTSDAVFGKTVKVDIIDRDRYGRSVGIVTGENGKT